jgi:hypothetical protein
LRIRSPLLFLILSPFHYLEQILWCHFSCQLISFLFKTQGFGVCTFKNHSLVLFLLKLCGLHDSTKSQENPMLMYFTSCVSFTLQNIESFLVKC